MATPVPLKLYNPQTKETHDAILNPFYVLYIFQVVLNEQQATGIRLLNETVFVLDADVNPEDMMKLFGA